MNEKIPSVVVVGGRTARELLVYVAGEAHQLHTVIGRAKSTNGAIKFHCSCGLPFEVAATVENKQALRNVPEMKK